MTEDLQLKIESYLGGTMPQDEVLIFEQQIESDSQLKEEVLLFMQINLHLSENDIYLSIPQNKYTQDLKAYMASDEAKEIKNTLQIANQTYKEHKVNAKRKKYLLVAATIALLIVSSIGLFFMNELKGFDKLYAQYYTSRDLPSIIKRGEQSSSLEKGVLAFKADSLSKAMEYFNSYKNTQPKEEVAVYLYTGATQLKLNNIQKAIEQFDIVINSNSLDASKGMWFKALTYLKAKDKTKAKAVLIEISKNPSYFNHNKAKEILDKL